MIPNPMAGVVSLACACAKLGAAIATAPARTRNSLMISPRMCASPKGATFVLQRTTCALQRGKSTSRANYLSNS
jgi:hypothetical protein